MMTGPGLSYTAVYIRKLFPCTKIVALHYAREFQVTEKLWDMSFYYSESGIPLSEQLFSYMGEEGITSCLFLSWKPSEDAFPDESKKCWSEIRSAVIKSRNVLATRSFFAKRWVKNAIRFSLFVNESRYFQKGTAPIVVCASGPSLESSIPFIQEHRNKFFLMAASSALLPLVHRGIVPDLCISCDGGYWAKRHISFALKQHQDIPLAMSSESAIYMSLFEETAVVPLGYGDGISESFLKEFDMPSTRAYRNGTVSGTAALLALSLTNGNVYFCGLDLAPSKGASHTRPNELEIDDSLTDNRLRTAETRLAPSSFPSPSLNIYRNWFASSSFGERLYRLSDHYTYQNNLGEVRDVNWEFFKEHESKEAPIMPMSFPSTKKLAFEKRLGKIRDAIDRNLGNPDWIREAVPADYIVYQRSIGMPGEAEALKKLQADIQSFHKDIQRAFS
ncbi:MAG: DUF115 domain-containing protein [Treponema sp.]|nr:DUF115 domain-containing protein [Treponema sp.]